MKKSIVVFFVLIVLFACSNENEVIKIEPEKKCWVKFNTAGGGFVLPIIVPAGEIINLSSFEVERPWRSLEGWFFDKDFTMPCDSQVLVMSNMTLYAKWNEVADDRCAVEFYTGYGWELLPTRFVRKNEKVHINNCGLTKVLKHEFDGWYLDEKYTQRFDEDSPITSDLRLYGRWVKKK